MGYRADLAVQQCLTLGGDFKSDKFTIKEIVAD